MAKYVALTARKLKPGAYDAWREAWAAVDGPAGVTAYLCRNVSDPDEVVAFGMIETTREEFEAMRPRGDAEASRLALMEPYIESISTDGLYEVIDEVTF